MRLRNYVFALLFIGVLAGCKESTTEPTQSTTYIMPLKTGNSWNYKVYIVEPTTGMKIDSKQDYTTTVGAESTIAGEKWFQVTNFIGKGNDELGLQLKSDGLWAYGDNEAGLFFKYPATANTTFTNPAGTWTVVSTSVKVDAGGKSYTCYQYKAPVDFQDGDVSFYVAPGVGLVKMTMVATEQGTTYNVSQELQSYTLK